MENVLREKFSDYSSVKPAVMSQRDVYLDEDGFTNRKAFVDFVNFLDREDKVRVAFVDVLLIANKKGRAFGTKALKSFYDNIAKNFIIFRMAGTKFNVMLKPEDEENFRNFMEGMKKQEKIWESLFQFSYVIVPKVICSENLSEILRQGIDSLFAERNKKAEKETEEISLEDLLASIETKDEPVNSQENRNFRRILSGSEAEPAPKVEIQEKPVLPPEVIEEKIAEPVSVPEPEPEKQQEEITYAKVYEMPERKEKIVVADKVIDRIRIDNCWRSEITLHETAPDDKIIKLYVFPFMLVDFTSHCPFVMIKDDLLSYNVQGGKSANVLLDRMQFSITINVTAQGQLQAQCLRAKQENVKGECEVNIQNFSGSIDKLQLSIEDKLIFPLKPNVYGNWDFVVKDGRTLILSQNGLWEYNGIRYTVTADEEEFYLTRTYEEEKVIK